MVLRICTTCKGMKMVRNGGKFYICPTCHGSGGTPLGGPPNNFDPRDRSSGTSRAMQHIVNRQTPSPPGRNR